MFEGLISKLNLFYSMQEPYARVRFAGDNDPSLFIVLMHQSLIHGENYDVVVSVDVYEFFGAEASPKFEVEDRDVLIVLAKRHDMIVASQVFEVNFGAVADGYLLLPRGGFNLLCDQNEMEGIDPEREATQPLVAANTVLPWYAGMDVEEPVRQDLDF